MTPVALIAAGYFLFELLFPATTDRGELFYKTEPDVMPRIPDVVPAIPEQNPPPSTAAVE